VFFLVGLILDIGTKAYHVLYGVLHLLYEETAAKRTCCTA
jgi:hypothetical protein